MDQLLHIMSLGHTERSLRRGKLPFTAEMEKPLVTSSRHSGSELTLEASHRITESQNSRGWKGPLWVI